MLVRAPSRREIQQLQDREEAYYFSAAFEVVLRKHGWLGIVDNDSLLPAFATRGYRPPEGEEICTVCEGPIDESILTRLNVSAETYDSKLLAVTGENLSSRFCYSSFDVRRIVERGVSSEPFPFACRDDKWNRDGFSFQAFAVNGRWQSVLTAIDEEGRTFTVAVSDGKHLLLGLPLFDAAAFEHAFPPLENAGYFALTRYGRILPIEQWLLRETVPLLLSAGKTLIRADTWPDGYTSAFSIRHDFDRPIEDSDLCELLNHYDEHDLKASWFWLEKTFNKEQIDSVCERGHEVALHTTAGDEASFRAEYQNMRSACEIPLRGATAHGGFPTLGYVGARQMEWCSQAGLQYGEMLGKANGMPHLAVLVENGVPAPNALMIPTTHSSLDISMKPEGHDYDRLKTELPAALEKGEHFVLMNHPDIHIPELRKLTAEVPASTWKATLLEVCRWNKTLKGQSRVAVRDGRVIVEFPVPVPQPSTIRTLSPTAEHCHRVDADVIQLKVNLKNGDSQAMNKPQLSEYFGTIRDLIVDDYKGDEEAAQPTIQVNTRDLEKRAQAVLEHVRITEGDVVAEMGCGYGFLGLALALLSDVKVVGYDLQDYFLDVGRQLVLRHPELRSLLQFETLDYAKESLDPNSVDVAVLNNTFCYVVGRDRQRGALRNLHQALRPGGRIYFFHPNLWNPREPFTKMLFVHWMPRGVGNWLTTRKGKRTLTDLDYQSPRGLGRMLREAGFCDVAHHPRVRKYSKLRKHFEPYYVMTATKPVAESRRAA